MKKQTDFYQTQKFAIAIPALFFLSCLTKHYIERFRFSSEFRWIYEYGSNISLSLCCLLVIFSFVNSISMFDLKIKLIPKLFWILLIASVFLYIAIGMIIVMFE